MAAGGGGMMATVVSVVVVMMAACLVLALAAPGLENDAATWYPTTEGPGLACNGGFILVGGRCVLVEPFTQSSWLESRYLCQTLGGDLVVLDSMDFYADLLTHLEDLGLDAHDYWVGGSVSGLKQSWQWVDGSSVRDGTPLWAQFGGYEQEPNGSGGCAFLDLSRYLYVDDDICDDIKHCICQTPQAKFAVATAASSIPDFPTYVAKILSFFANSDIDKPAIANPAIKMTDIANTAVATPAQNCSGAFELVGGKCVLVDPFTSSSWAESRYFCQRFGGDLVVLDSMDFYAALLDYIKEKGLDTHSYWVGASNSYALEWTWQWVDSTSVKEGTPLWGLHYEGSDDYHQVPHGTSYFCGVLLVSDNYYLYDHDCDSHYTCICQAPEGGDVLEEEGDGVMEEKRREGIV